MRGFCPKEAEVYGDRVPQAGSGLQVKQAYRWVYA